MLLTILLLSLFYDAFCDQYHSNAFKESEESEFSSKKRNRRKEDDIALHTFPCYDGSCILPYKSLLGPVYHLPVINDKNQKLLIKKCIALLKCSEQLFLAIQP